MSGRGCRTAVAGSYRGRAGITRLQATLTGLPAIYIAAESVSAGATGRRAAAFGPCDLREQPIRKNSCA